MSRDILINQKRERKGDKGAATIPDNSSFSLSSHRGKVWLGVLFSLLALYLVLFQPKLGAWFRGEEGFPKAFIGHPRINWPQVWVAIQGAQWSFVLLNFLLFPVSIVFRAWRWILLTPKFKGRFRFIDSFSLQVIGYLMNCVLPLKMGEVVRGLLMAKVTSLPNPTAMGTVLVERLVDVASLLLIVAITAFIFPYPSSLVEIFWVLGAISILAFLGMIYLSVAKNPYRGILGRLIGGRLAGRRLRRVLDRFIHSFTILKDGNRLLPVVLLTAVIYPFYLLQLWALLTAFGVGTRIPLMGSPTLLALVVIFIIETLGLSAPSGPSGLGIYHASVVFALLLFEVPTEVGFGIALVGHAVMVIFSLMGIIPMMWLGIRWRELSEMRKVYRDRP